MNKSIRRILASLISVSLVMSAGVATLMADEGDGKTILIEVGEGEEAEAEFGDIQASERAGYSDSEEDALHIDVYEDGKATVTAGNIVSEGEAQDALDVRTYDDGTANITTGSLTGNDDGLVAGAYDNSSISVTVDGDINAEYYGMDIWANEEASTDITVNGDVQAVTGPGALIGASDNGTVNLTIDGNVSSQEEEGLYIDVYYTTAADVNVNVSGDIDSAYTGAYLYVDGESTATLTVGGNISSEDSIGVFVEVDEASKAEVNVAGDVDCSATGVSIEASDDASTTVTIGGSINADNETSDGCGILAFGSDNSTINVNVEGDVAASAYGVGFGVVDSPEINVVVAGTISGETKPIITMYGEDTTATITITAWQIVLDEDGNAATRVEIVDMDTDEMELIPDEELEKSIRYIVKLEQPDQGDILSATDAEGKALPTSDKYEYALEGEKILCKVEDHYRIVAAYNGKGEKQELQMDEDGNYYVIVPKGGGVYLSVKAELEKYKVTFKDEDGTVLQESEVEYGAKPEYTGKTPTKESTDQYEYTFEGWTTEISEVTGETTYTAKFKETLRSYTLTFNLDGGQVDGKSEYTVEATYGSIIILPKPTKDGLEFAYWEGSRYDAGAEYVIKGAHSFKAIWKEAKAEENKSGTPKTEENKSGTPKTGDLDNGYTNAGIVLILASMAAATICIVRKKETV